MRVTVIGTGFVGVVTSAVFASLGHEVYGLDVDEHKVDSLSSGVVPFFEPGLEDLLKEGLDAGKLSFTSEYETAISVSDIVFVAVGTPSAPDGTADMKYVLQAAESMAPYLQQHCIVVLKSTVPPSTNSLVTEKLIEFGAPKKVQVVSVPEFLKEGSAVEDTLHPDRVVIGASDPDVIETLLTLHEPLGGERVVVSAESAQMAKYTANAYLAQRITFINQIANLCEQNGAHIQEVIEVIGKDSRIGEHYWYPGLGYGGSCFPKDVKELAAYAKSVGEEQSLLVTLDKLNEQRMKDKLHEFDDFVGGFDGKTVALLGLSFKPNTNDMREAPAMYVIPYLRSKGALIKAYDPEAMDEAGKHFTHLFLADDAYMAAEDADIIMLLTEWDELCNLDAETLISHMNQPAYFIDTRNQYMPEEMRAVGFDYRGIGNP